MAKQPFSAPKPRSLPTSTPTVDINQTLSNWQTQLRPLVQNVAPQATPQNFSVTNSRGGVTLNWSPVAGADGYEILRSLNGSFSDDLQIISVNNPNQSSYFDSLGGNAQTASYRIRTTSGTGSNPQSARGPESGPVKHTSIDAADTKSVPVTVFDNATTDSTRANARRGNYGAIKQSALGKSGGSGVGSGTASSSGSGGGSSNPPPSAGSTSFSLIGTGTNNLAAMTVASGAALAPDPSSPGIISANQIQGVPVVTDGPADGMILQALGGILQYNYPQTVVTATTNFAAVAGQLVACTNTISVTLPSAAVSTNAPIAIKNQGAGVITVTPNGGDTIDGAASFTINYTGSCMSLLCDGVSNWIIE